MSTQYAATACDNLNEPDLARETEAQARPYSDLRFHFQWPSISGPLLDATWDATHRRSADYFRLAVWQKGPYDLLQLIMP